MTTSQRVETITPLEVGRRLPPFRLPLTTGGLLTPSAYRGRANLAVFVLPAADELAAAVLRGVAHRCEQLFDVQWNAVGARVDRVDDLPRRRQPGAEQERGDEGRLILRQPLDSQLLGEALRQQA